VEPNCWTSGEAADNSAQAQGIHFYEVPTMPNLTDLPETPKLDDTKLNETPEEKANRELNETADAAAKKASKTEQRYDKATPIFTK
jgi:hypothetical protein